MPTQQQYKKKTLFSRNSKEATVRRAVQAVGGIEGDEVIELSDRHLDFFT